LGGDDELIGNAGADILQGGDGNDVLVGGADADQIDGGSGMDLVSYSTSTAPVTVYLSQGTASGGDAQGDKLISVESAMGSDFNDTLYGGADGNVLVGLLGNDVLFGGGGDDIIRGDKGDDLLYGEAGSDWLEGGDGNDDFFGDAGGDWLDGGNGIDYVSYGMSDAAVTVRLDVGVALGGYAQGDRLVSIEEVLGSSYNDTLVADARGNTLYGMFGDDLLIGGAGADLMI
ncbi:calcium-binding protein, partial [Azospirillum himalayense]